MQLIKFLLVMAIVFWISDAFGNNVAKKSVLVCYGRLEPESIKGYDYLIIESQHYDIYEVRRLKLQNEKVFAYVSLGEINENSPYFPLFKDEVSKKNEIWNSYYLNLESPKTVESLKRIIRDILAMGYDGMFLDNIDNYGSYGPQSMQKEALIEFLKELKDEFPDRSFIQNAGIDLLDQTSPYVLAVVVESVATDYDFDSKLYRLRDKQQFEERLKNLDSVRKKSKLPFILIEYADSKSLCEAIMKRLKSSGFDLFIGNISLQAIPEFSK